MNDSSALRTPNFIYFDMGNVLLFFDHHLAARQMAEVAGVDEAEVWRVVFESGLNDRCDAGKISTEEFYELFCRQIGARPDKPALCRAASNIFRVNSSLKPVVGHLSGAGYRLGLLSNICQLHWDYVSDGRFGLIPDTFDVLALSFRLKAIKPHAEIYRKAAELAQVAPEEIFYVDDIAGHVEAACAAGFDAVQYTTTPVLVNQLRRRRLEFNY